MQDSKALTIQPLDVHRYLYYLPNNLHYLPLKEELRILL